MKRTLVVLAALSMTFGLAQAQTMEEVTSLYNTGVELAQSDRELALKAFEQAYEQALTLGEDGAEIAANCKGVIPDLYLSVAKGLVNDGAYDAAIAKLQQTIEKAQSMDAAEIAAEATGLIPVVYKQNGGVLLNAKNYAAAAEAFKKALEADPTDGVASLRLGLALNGAGDLAGAKEALLQAAANGQESSAKKQLATICLKQAASSLKAKSYADAVAQSLESAQYNETAQAYQIAGQASRALGKANDAITYFDKYLEISPNAKNAAQIAFTIGALYQQNKNNAKAVEYYEKAVNDPQLGEQAKQLINALK